MNNTGYKTLGNYWCKSCCPNKEQFFVSYALNGSLIPGTMTRYGMPQLWPMEDSPVHGPSPLNNQYMYYIKGSTQGVL